MSSTVHPVSITGVGAYLPPVRLTNAELAKRFDITEDWIDRRTGIAVRCIAAPDQVTSDLAKLASEKALGQADLSPGDLDLIILATLSPDQPIPATACFLQEKLGASGIPAFDVSAACSGFLYALSIARQYVASGAARHVLVVGAEATSRIIDEQDRGTSILFGDGAGAVIVSRGGGKLRLGDVRLGADGSKTGHIRIEAGGSRLPTSAQTVERRQQFMAVKGKEVYRIGVEKFSSLVTTIVEQHGLTIDQIAQIITHQSNVRMIDAAIERTGLPKEKFWCNVDRIGNTCAASIPICLCEYLDSNGAVEGAIIAVSVGGGMTWASALIEATT